MLAEKGNQTHPLLSVRERGGKDAVSPAWHVDLREF
jgi:hypothetical protein